MEKLDTYIFDLKAMKEDVESRLMVADEDFFVAVDGSETRNGNVEVSIEMRQVAGSFKAFIRFHGEVEVTCDRCLEPMMQPVSGEAELRIKLGDMYEDDGEVIVVPEQEGIVDLSWQVYEQIALQIPMRHVHRDGECRAEMQQALDKMGLTDEAIADEKPTDPRWDALKKLISTNN